MSERIDLNHTLGKSYGTNVSEFTRFTSWIEANLRLGRPMTIIIDKFGSARMDDEEGDS